MTSYPKTHACTLRVLVKDKLFPLPPNASGFRRFLRFLRILFVLDPRHIKCRTFFRNRPKMFFEQKRHAKGHWFIIHPFSLMSICLEVLFFYIWMSNIIMLSFVFFQLELGYVSIFFILKRVNGILQWLIFISFFFQGYVDYQNNIIYISARKIIFHYVKTYFLFDLVATAGEDLFFWKKITKTDTSFYYFEVMTYLVAHLIRVYTLGKSLNSFSDLFKLSRSIKTLVQHYIIISILIHIFSSQAFCIPYMIHGHNIPKDSWLHQSKLNRHRTFFDVYSQSILIVTCYFFGATFGMFQIRRFEEELIFLVIGMLGRLYTLFALANLLSVFGLVGVSRSKFENNLSQLEEYMNSNHLPNKLRRRILTYFEYKLQKRYFNESQIDQTLSDYLKSELFLYGARKLIDKANILRQLPKTALGALFAHMKCDIYLTNDTISQVGTPIEQFFFILSGTVAVINDEGIEFCHLEDGDEFGFVDLFARDKFDPSSETYLQKFKYVAVETTEIYCIESKLMLEFLSDFPDVMRHFLHRVQQRVHLYMQVQQNYRSGREDFISKLREGAILEKRKLRTYIE